MFFFNIQARASFCRIHQTLRVTQAMEAGIADHFWTIAEIVGLIG
jgi:hypothetical protein